jgi:DNA polymerase-1
MNFGPEDFGGTDEGSHYCSQMSAAKLLEEIRAARRPVFWRFTRRGGALRVLAGRAYLPGPAPRLYREVPSRMIVIDLETELISPGNLAPPPICTALAVGRGDVAVGVGAPLASLFAPTPDVLGDFGPLVGHNIAFDLGVIAQDNPETLPAIFSAYRRDLVTCTMLRQQLLDIAGGIFPEIRRKGGPGYSLDATAVRHRVRGKIVSEWQKRFGELRGLPLSAYPPDALAYVRNDVEVARNVYRAQGEGPVSPDEYRQARAAFALHLTSAWGFVVDPKRVAHLKRVKEARIAELSAICLAAGLVRPDGSRIMAPVRARVEQTYLSRGLPVPYSEPSPKFPNGQVKTDALTCSESGDPVLAAFGDLGEELSFVNNFLPTLEAGILNPGYGLAESGRSTSFRPNSQNFPTSTFEDKDPRKKDTPGVRECCVPRPGYLYGIADFGGLELCTQAQMCLDILGRSSLAREINEGIDPHLTVAATLLRIPYEEAKARFKAGNDEAYRARQTGKVANFGLPGGLGVRRLVDYAMGNYGIRITEGEARALKSAWLALRPEMSEFFAFVDDAVTRRGFIVQLRSGRVRGGVGYTDACNTFFQGLGADIAKAALFDVAEACYAIPTSPLFGCRPCNFVHDEIVLEAPEYRAAEAAEELSRLMVAAAQPWLPGVKIHAPPVLARCWSKGAKEIRDPGGRLVPWDVNYS